MKIKYLGHSAFEVTLGEEIFLIDPWVTGNPKSSLNRIEELESVNYVLVTHEHADHGFEDAVKICKNTGAKFVGVFEMAEKAVEMGVETLDGNTGGKISLEEGIRIHFTHAIHPTKANQPCGFIIEDGNQAIYHAGDTALFSDMRLIGEKVDIDVALLPIGDVYTMDPKDASKAVDLIKPKYIVPMHYNTFDVLTGTVEEFEKSLKEPSRLKPLKPGDTFEI